MELRVEPTLNGRSATRLAAMRDRGFHGTDRLFAWLFLVQWAVAIALAVAISSGDADSDVLLAIGGGGLVNVLPLALIWTRPGRASTRHAVAVAQMLWSALFLTITNGRVETHFHVFASLALLALYRDWKVLPTATAVVVVDHLLRWMWWPDSIYDVANPEWWRFLEHATWIAFEDLVLALGCIRQLADMRAAARREIQLEEVNANVEREVQVRTRQLVEQTHALDRSQERHRILFDASPLPIWVFDPVKLRILAVNEAMVELLGYTRDELLARRVIDLKPPEDHQPLVKWMEQAKVGLTYRAGVRRYLTKANAIVELEITTHGTLLDGELVILALGVDVTHSRRTEEQLRQAQKMDAIGQLAGGVAHDFNNILAAILGCNELAMDSLAPDHPALADLREVEAAAQRAATLTRQLLAVSRQQRTEISPIALNSVVTTLEKMLSRVVGEDIDMAAVLAPQLGTVEADRGQLEQILMNLVVNARDAMPEGGRLTIETVNTELDAAHAALLGVEPGRFVVLAVSDTGCGMDQPTIARAFDPFFTTKEVGKGTGLGLSIVFGIVKQSGGAVAIYSEVGKGSTFRIYLPRVAEPADTAAPAPAIRPPLVGGHQRILLVEDDDRLRRVISRQLTAWGYTLLEASNATVALELLAGTLAPVDLLVTDLVMPGLDGRALASKVLATSPATKVLFMSGYTHHAAVKTASLTAHDRFIDKPFTSHKLSAAVRSALET